MLFEFAENTPDNYQTLFVELIIPLPVPKIYTYRVPNEWNDVIGIGTRVVVQFGAKKIYTALVVGVSENPPIGYQAKYILDVLDETPLLNQKQVLIFDELKGYTTGLEWSHNGSLLGSVNKDKTINIFDPRQGGPAMSAASHEGAKA